MPSRSARSSISASWAIAACGTPKPRKAPAGGPLVYTARLVLSTAPTSYGPTSKPDDVLWRAQGTAGERSPGFRAPDRWRIQWAFDCTNFERYGGGNFKITGDGAFEQQVQIENVAIEASGTRRFARGGFGHLRVESVCDRWTVTVPAG